MLNAERRFQTQLQEVLLAEIDPEEMEIGEASTFNDAGVMTMNAGLVVRMSNGDEFQVTIVQSVFSEDDDEEGF